MNSASPSSKENTSNLLGKKKAVPHKKQISITNKITSVIEIRPC